MIVLVTVTYNSSIFVDKLVDGVLSQTETVDKIVIVDNASNDENEERLKAIKNKSKNIILCRLNENSGGAGGFEYGMKYAIENFPECDWIWIMDDDAYPDPTCLENLLKYGNEENVGCIAPVIKSINHDSFQLNHHKLIKKYLDGDNPIATNYSDLKDIEYIEANSFVGPLFKKSAVSEIGFPNGKLFIEGDDTEYTYRLSRKYSIILVKDAIVNHRLIKIESKEQLLKSLWKQYYYFRNRFLFITEFSCNKYQEVIGKFKVLVRLLRASISARVNSKYREIRPLYISLLNKALRDGIKNIDGRVIVPADYFKDLSKFLNK